MRPKVGQNLKYDINVFARHGIMLAGVAHDTMLQSYVLDAAGNRHDMDTLADKYLGHKTISFTDIAGKRSEENTSELQSLMRISYAVFCLKKQKTVHDKCPHSEPSGSMDDG